MNVWDKVKQMFAEAGMADALPPDLPPVGAMTPYKLKDGTEVLIEKLETGGKVMMPDQTPVGAGTWEMEDGGVLVTDEAGMIVTYTAPAAVANVPDFDAQAQYTALASEFAEHKTAFAAMQEQAKRTEGMLTETLKTIQLMAQAFEQLGKKPQEAPPAPGQHRSNFSKDREGERREAAEKMMQAARAMAERKDKQ